MRHNAPLHHLEVLAEIKPPQPSVQDTEATLEDNNIWEALSPHVHATALAHVELYLDDFSGIVQGVPTERQI